jgi:hypothetical protein
LLYQPHGLESINDWVEHDNLAFTSINNCLNNSVVSHVESKLTSNLMCLYFIQNFEIKRVNDKNGQKDKLQTFIR